MIVRLGDDEWYPVYSIDPHSTFGDDVDVEQDRIDWWQRAHDDFTAAQDDMRAAIDEARALKRNRTIDRSA